MCSQGQSSASMWSKSHAVKRHVVKRNVAKRHVDKRHMVKRNVVKKKVVKRHVVKRAAHPSLMARAAAASGGWLGGIWRAHTVNRLTRAQLFDQGTVI